jgi:hypothetical protein
MPFYYNQQTSCSGIDSFLGVAGYEGDSVRGKSVATFIPQNEQNEENEDFDKLHNRLKMKKLGVDIGFYKNSVDAFTRQKSQVQIL